MTLRPIAAGDREEFVQIHEAAAPLWAPWIGAPASGLSWSDIFGLVLEMGSRSDQPSRGGEHHPIEWPEYSPD